MEGKNKEMLVVSKYCLKRYKADYFNKISCILKGKVISFKHDLG